MTGAPMRLAVMIETDGPGGAEMMVFRLSEELRRRGHTVVPVLPVPLIGWLGGLFRGAGFEVEEIPLGSSWLDVQRIQRIRRLIRERRIDVVHSHEFEMSVYGGTAAWLERVPQVMTIHGGLTVTNALRRRLALRWAIGRSATAVAVSRATGAQFSRDLGLGPATFTIVPNGVPETRGDATRVRGEFGCADDDVVLLAVGTLEENKGHRVLLSALVQVQRAGNRQPWRLIIAGGRGGDQHQALLEQAAAPELAGRVHIVTSRNDVADLQALADVFVMPSYREGMPMAVLEAMVAGNAIIASGVGGIPEAVTDGREGVLVPPGDVDALAGALRALLSDRARRQALGEAARARAHQHFTVSVMADTYERLYREAAKRHER
ncbi:MAG TPA: glycosyltransferase family 4 protein [Gemmatimonadaceae bacterium]|nr:glycosyltransferase family 4 protein [Gemmatimonadaceae bacterium]